MPEMRTASSQIGTLPGDARHLGSSSSEAKDVPGDFELPALLLLVRRLVTAVLAEGLPAATPASALFMERVVKSPVATQTQGSPMQSTLPRDRRRSVKPPSTLPRDTRRRRRAQACSSGLTFAFLSSAVS